MMMTPAGTIAPARVFIIGAGVAGLQAIATAKRLGARVEAFDTREVVAEQVESLGAKFIKVDLGETGQTKDGYAKALTDEQIEKQRQAMAKHCAQADVVITTAQVFGRKAPLIVTEEMIKGMRPGSVIVDLAAETGGNVAGSKPGETVEMDGVFIIGAENLPGKAALHASQMYSSNVYNLLTHFWNQEKKEYNLDLEDEIVRGCLVTHSGEIFSETLKNSK
jgi:NAD(P) transhydrogenase subunit alpha